MAVSMLGVNIPAPVAIWLLEDGRSAVSELLRAIPAEADICENGELLDPGRETEALWRLLGNGCWPDPIHSNGMGTTKISKLLAAKRPNLVPIFDW